MFALRDRDFKQKILGCGDGPASFNATASRRGCRVSSADPLYRFSKAQSRSGIEETTDSVVEQIKQNMEEFVWTHFGSVDVLVRTRTKAMHHFLADYSEGKRVARYLDASLPKLPFPNEEFDVALCSHFLFLYSKQHDTDFHIESIIELRRVSREVRLFPLLELDSAPSRHLEAVSEGLGREGYGVERKRVSYEFQKSGNEMLRVV